MTPFRVLFITSSRLGDAVLSTSCINYLAKKHKKISLTVVCGVLPAGLFRSIPFCDRVITTHKKSFSRHWIDVWNEVKGTHWDLVIDLRGTFLSYALCTKKRIRWSNNVLSHHPSPHMLHQVDRLKFIWQQAHRSIHPMQEDITQFRPTLWLQENHVKAAQQRIAQPTLALAPTANWMGKEWPLPYFTEITQRFLQTFPEHHILLLAAPFEGKALTTLMDALDPKLKERTHIMLSPDLNEVAATLKQCDMFLGNDSGLMHMAASLSVPTIGLFGPSNDRRYGPFGDNTIILRTPQTLKDLESLPGFSYKANKSFMTDLSVETVWNTLSNQWERMHVKIDHLAHVPLWGKS